MQGRLLSLMIMTLAAPALPAQSPKTPRRVSRLLSAPYYAAALLSNRVYCGVDAVGGLCSEYGEFSGGGVWPYGTPDFYIFSSGLQVAGIIPAAAGGGKPTFAWAGDTTGAFFMDPRGDQQNGYPLSKVFDSRDTSALRQWPIAAVARDTAIYDARLIGRTVVSDQDLWTRYWDGNPRFQNGRSHPMGLLVDQRAMAFTASEDQQDIIYFVITLYNVTARDPSVYANPTIAPELRSDIAALGARFQDSSESFLGVNIPDVGYRIDSLYVGLYMDADVGNASFNYSNVVFPFGLGAAYKSDFLEPLWGYPLNIFGPPFTKAPGFVGAKFLRSPLAPDGIANRIAMFTNYSNSSVGHPDAVGVSQLWRYLSGNSSAAAGDNDCQVQGSQQRLHYCFLVQSPQDTRFMQSTGPFSLDPGQATTIILAYVFAAPTPAVEPYIGGDLQPGIPYTGDSIAADSTKLRVFERAAGWVTQKDSNADGIIEESEVTTLPRSLLDKAKAAQSLADHKFLLPSAPEPPAFYLIPGDNQVTITWQPSPTEVTGDPYFAAASDPTSGLYDPNYRSHDVEGYRIYRGRDPNALQLVAQFDYSGTEIVDYTGALLYPGDCAPELGVMTSCPNFASGVAHDLGYNVIQVPLGGRIVVAGHVYAERTDTAVTGGGSGFPGLDDRGVGFVYVDKGVRNSFSYYYSVTAFDVNSIRSGRSSLESARLVHAVTPRIPSGQETSGNVGPLQILAADGHTLSDSAPIPTISPTTGMFSGPMPPTDGLHFGFNGSFVPQLVTGGTTTLTIDSIIPGSPSNFSLPAPPANSEPVYYLTIQGTGPATHAAVPLQVDFFSSDVFASGAVVATHADQGQAKRYGGDSTMAIHGSVFLHGSGTWRLASWGRASLNGDPSNSDQAGPRWWAGSANENVSAPNELVCSPASTACVQADLSRNSGRLPGVAVLFHLQAYSTVPNLPMRNLEGIGASVTRAADFQLFWGAGGHVDSVVDVTHGVSVPFSPALRASWGFLTDSSFILGNTQALATADSNNALLTWSDVFCVAPVPAYLGQCGGTLQNPAVFQDHARLSPVAAQSSTYGTAATLPTTGNGFILYLNGHFFLMQLATLPAAGTVWHARFFAGSITGTAAAGNYAFIPAARPPAVPGLRAQVAYSGAIVNAKVTADSNLARIHTVPDPYYVTNALETSPTDKQLRFVHLPAQAIIRIYSASGILVQVVTHNDPTGGGEANWDLHSRNGRSVASGVYFYHVETPDGRSRIGRFTIVTARP